MHISTASGGERVTKADAQANPKEEILVGCRNMRVAELRAELSSRGLRWADCLDKEELCDRLADCLMLEAQYSKSGKVKPGKVAQLTGLELDQELSHPSTPILLDIFATWCGPCMMMAPQLEAAAQKLQNKVRVVKIDS